MRPVRDGGLVRRTARDQLFHTVTVVPFGAAQAQSANAGDRGSCYWRQSRDHPRSHHDRGRIHRQPGAIASGRYYDGPVTSAGSVSAMPTETPAGRSTDRIAEEAHCPSATGRRTARRSVGIPPTPVATPTAGTVHVRAGSLSSGLVRGPEPGLCVRTGVTGPAGGGARTEPGPPVSRAPVPLTPWPRAAMPKAAGDRGVQRPEGSRPPLDGYRGLHDHLILPVVTHVHGHGRRPHPPSNPPDLRRPPNDQDFAAAVGRFPPT